MSSNAILVLQALQNQYLTGKFQANTISGISFAESGKVVVKYRTRADVVFFNTVEDAIDFIRENLASCGVHIPGAEHV